MPNENMMRVFHIDDGENTATYNIRDSHVNIGYGECSTVAATTAKEATLQGDIGWGLRAGSFAIIKFTYSVPANATLNIASTGAKAIYHKNAAIAANVIKAGDLVTFAYNGTNYVVISIDRVMSGVFSEMVSGDVTTALGYTPLDSALKGAASGVAELDSNGKVPSSQLPSYVDDVLEYSNLEGFPVTGESGKIYVAQDTNKTYRWSGSAYVEISESLALGTTSSTAFRGDYGESAYAHAVTNKGSEFSSGLYKITTNSEGHVTNAEAVQKSDITGLGLLGNEVIATTYESTASYAAGDYCIHNDTLYRCSTAIGSGGEAWTAAHWTAVTVGEELTSQNSQITNLNSCLNGIGLANVNGVIYIAPVTSI